MVRLGVEGRMREGVLGRSLEALVEAHNTVATEGRRLQREISSLVGWGGRVQQGGCRGVGDTRDSDLPAPLLPTRC